MLRKLVYAVSALLSSIASAVPEHVRTPFYVFASLIVLDALTGIGVAVLKGSVSSSTMRRKTCAKMLQYAMVLGIAAAAATLAGNWVLLQIAVCGLCGIEVTSLMENATCLQDLGVSLGPLNGFFERIKPYLAVSPASPPSLSASPQAAPSPSTPEKKETQTNE